MDQTKGQSVTDVPGQVLLAGHFLLVRRESGHSGDCCTIRVKLRPAVSTHELGKRSVGQNFSTTEQPHLWQYAIAR